MGEKYLGQLTAKTAPATGDIMVLEDSEDTKKIDYDALANAILNKLTTKTYTVAGGTQTLISAINALNSNLKGIITSFSPSTAATLTLSSVNKYGCVYVLSGSLCGVYFVNTNKDGIAYVKDVKTIERVSVSTSGNAVTISSSGISGTIIFAPILL